MTTQLSVMKNRLADHDWHKTGGYDPEQDGPEPQWGRIAVECSICGEQRRIYHLLPLDDPGLTSGCRRPGSDAWQPGDLLVRAGGFLDTFEGWEPDGRVRTSNGTGPDHISEPGQLYPY